MKKQTHQTSDSWIDRVNKCIKYIFFVNYSFKCVISVTKPKCKQTVGGRYESNINTWHLISDADSCLISSLYTVSFTDCSTLRVNAGSALSACLRLSLLHTHTHTHTCKSVVLNQGAGVHLRPSANIQGHLKVM